MDGFVGGACSREIIRQQALEVLAVRSGRLVSIRPDASETGDAEHVFVPMTCVSEGAIDVYIEPFVQARRLVVAGATPVAEALTRLARAMDYDVVRAVDEREREDVERGAESLGVEVVTLDALDAAIRTGGPDRAAVVVSQGHYDEQALESVLRGGLAYVGLVASRVRGAAVRKLLEERGVPGTETIRNPAGLELGARTPPEVALSILAEIVQAHPRGAVVRSPDAASPAVAPQALAFAIDPVCGMRVEIATAQHTAEVDGTMYYFCCSHCRLRFLQDPQSYRTRAS
jgi:xanthine dehydrogenase accessory factor